MQRRYRRRAALPQAAQSPVVDATQARQARPRWSPRRRHRSGRLSQGPPGLWRAHAARDLLTGLSAPVLSLRDGRALVDEAAIEKLGAPAGSGIVTEPSAS